MAEDKEQMKKNETDPTREETPNEASTPESTPIEILKAEEITARVAELEALAIQYKDQLLRKAAEFENYKRRMETDVIERGRYATEHLLESLIPVLDDFERSLKMTKESRDFDTLYRGVELIRQKLLKTLERAGMKPYESVGKPFDTDYHDALLQMPREDVPPHTIIEEVEKGYMLNDKILRHAKVVVASDPAEPANASSTGAAAGETPGDDTSSEPN